MTKITLVVRVALLCACSSPQHYDFVIQQVGFFDGENDLGVVNIGVNADTIAAISTDELLSDSIIDGNGKYVIPGLVNSHVHIWESEQLRAGYASGILCNMGMHASNHERDSVLKSMGEEKGFPLYYSSAIAATVPGGHPTQITPGVETINDSVSVTMFVDNRIADGSDYIKIIKESSPWFGVPNGPPSLPYDSIRKIIDYAHSKNMKVVVHIGSLEEMVRIAEMKPDGFVHMWYSSVNSELTKKKLETIKSSNAFVVPTALVNQRALVLTAEGDGDFAVWAREKYLSMDGIRASITALHHAGVLILAGTDNGNFDLNWDDDLIKELLIYSECGLTNIDVLRTATGNPARAWGIPVGMLRVGKKANLLLLNENPIEDLQALRDINTIWKNGESEVSGG